jgi:DNA-binding response OmpR family regulator
MLGLKMKKGEHPAGLVVEALKLDSENSEAHELFRNLAGLGETGPTQEQEVFELALEVDRNGNYDQAMILLDLLMGTNLKDKAEDAILKIRRHSGIEETGPGEGRSRGTIDGRFAGTKVLVVDDEREILLLLEQILTGEGFKVFTAMDGQEGLGVYMRERPPLVVTDAMMPKLHGFELCRRIKEESDNTAKVMILTAVYKKYKYKGKVQEEYNVDEYLDKPFQITEFLETFIRMAEKAREAPKYLPSTVPETEGMEEQQLSLLLLSGTDAELAEKVTTYCQRHEIDVQAVRDPGQLVAFFEQGIPDIVLLTDSFPGLESSVAAVLLKGFLDLSATTVVLVTRDRSKLEGAQDSFDHRVFAPIDKSVLDTIVQIHRSSAKSAGGGGKKSRSYDEKRIDSLVRSKVARILKSHSQLEEYYTTRVRELEEEMRRLREEQTGKEVKPS